MAGGGRGERGQLVRICDLAGRPRGTGFVADEHGTLITSHEAVDGLAQIVLHAPGGRTCVVTADAVVPLPEAALALVRTEGLGVCPLPVSLRPVVEEGSYVRIAARGWREARVLAGAASVTYTATDRFHLLPAAMELAIGTDGSDALQLGSGAAGGPVVDAATGAVLGVLGTALHSGHRAAGFAVSLREAAAARPGGALDELLCRNAATVPAYGRDLNLAGALQLTATSVGSDGPRDDGGGDPVERAGVEREFASFLVDSPLSGVFGMSGVAGASGAYVLGLVGDPGSGRTTALAALAGRRARGAEPAPTVWLRGAGLRDSDVSVADAVGRALGDAGRIVAASEGQRGVAWGEEVADAGPHPHRARPKSPVAKPTSADLGDIGPDRVARLVRDAGRPLLVLLDCPEEMPPVLAHRLAEWSAGSARWLRETGARLVVACRAEYWEQAGALFPAGALHGTDARLPGCVRLGDLTEREARRARARHGIPDGVLAPADAGHPLALRLLGEVRAALPVPPDGRPTREDVFTAYLDLVCLRIAVRLAAAQNLRGTAVRQLAARVSGQVHEAARRCLGPGQGELDRESFESVFPWSTGWAPAALTEGLLVPAGAGYRFAHEELADWIQGMHLDVDAALEALVHRWREAGAEAGRAAEEERRVPPQRVEPRPAPRRRGRAGRSVWRGAQVPDPTPSPPSPPSSQSPARSLPVPRHRIGPVVQALLLLGRQQGSAELAARLEELVHAAQEFAGQGRSASGGSGDVRDGGAGEGVKGVAPDVAEVPARGRVPQWGGDARPEAGRGSGRAGTVGAGSASAAVGGTGTAPAGTRPGRSDLHPLDAPWWAVRLLGEVLSRVPDARPYLGVLRLLVERIAARGQVRGVLGEFGAWFWRGLPLPAADRMDLLRRLVVADAGPGRPGDERALDAVGDWLRAEPGIVQPLLTRWFNDARPLPAAPEATVARAAQALLHTHRHRAIDELTEALVDCAHPHGDELLAALADEEPSAVCRAVDRWAHDERPERRVAATAYGLRAAPHVTTEADRGLLRYAALALLARPADCTLHGAALALLVRDPQTRSRHLPLALRRFAASDPQLPASALAAALTTHPEPVLAAFQARLHEPGPAAGEVLGTLAEVSTPALARRVAVLVRDFLELRPEAASHAAAYLDRRLDHGPAARAVLFPLVSGLLQSRPVQVRIALAPVLAAPGRRASRPLRAELLEVLLEQERDLAVLDAVLNAAGQGGERWGEARARDLVHRVGLLLVRTPEGAACFDRRLVDLSRRLPGFAASVARWIGQAPQEWAAVVGPSARRTVESLAGVRVPA